MLDHDAFLLLGDSDNEIGRPRCARDLLERRAFERRDAVLEEDDDVQQVYSNADIDEESLVEA
jgi:hypothetical protein